MVTLRMIAEKCGVSVATVSKALNGADDLSESTIERIRQVANSLGYMPNAAARALKTSRSYSFGVIYEEALKYGLTHEFFSRILNSFMTRSQSFGYDMFFIGDRLADRDITYAEHARYRNCDGVLVIAGTDRAERATEKLSADDFPIVCIDYEVPGFSSVLSDNARGVRDLVLYAHGLGHRKIAFVHGEDTRVTRIRVDAFRQVCGELGLSLPGSYVIEARYHDADRVEKAAYRLLDLPDPPTCILFPDDVSYVGALNAFTERGLCVPRDVSVMGYDGVELGQLTRPRLTTLRQNAEAMGAAAAEILVRAAEAGDGYQPERVVIPGKLQPGGTVRRL